MPLAAPCQWHVSSSLLQDSNEILHAIAHRRRSHPSFSRRSHLDCSFLNPILALGKVRFARVPAVASFIRDEHGIIRIIRLVHGV